MAARQPVSRLGERRVQRAPDRDPGQVAVRFRRLGFPRGGLASRPERLPRREGRVLGIALWTFSAIRAFWKWWLALVWFFGLALIGMLMWGGVFGLPYVENERWGGLILT